MLSAERQNQHAGMKARVSHLVIISELRVNFQEALQGESKKKMMIDVCLQTTRPESGARVTCTLASTHGDDTTEALYGPNAFITKESGRE
jgi:hypothetical protein